MNTKTAIESWALYPWFEEHGSEMIHAEDIARLKALMPYGKVFQVVGSDKDFAVLRYGQESFRVKPALTRAVNAPAFTVGQKVRVHDKSVETQVVDVCWHHKDLKPFFHVSFSGKRSGRRYWANDLEAI